MVNRTLLAFFISLLFSWSDGAAQSLFQDTAIYKKADLHPVMGRDFWFTPPALFTSQSKDYDLCITSPKNCVVQLRCGTKFSTTITVKAGLTSAFLLPLTHEVTSSSIVEPEDGYHAWCDSADLDVMLVADNPTAGAGDAMHILPTFALGNDYIVASYAALYLGEGNSYDYPSEFTITGQHDNTVITIVPSADIRQETQSSQNPTQVAHPAGQPFPVTLQRGECIQFKTVEALDLEHYDLTGTQIHTTFPVAVIGASQRPYIPSTYPHWDYVADMIPPIRSWGLTYYTAPFAQSSGVTTHDASSYLVIGSKENQTIYRTDPSTGTQIFCQLAHKYDFSLSNDIELASRWNSDAPFMLVQYMNSPDYPDSAAKAIGSPSMMVIPPVELFGTSGRVQTPVQSGNFAANFNMYVNVIANINSLTATFDGTNIKTWTKKPIDSAWTIYRGANITQGAHTFQSDMPIAVYAYGYGNTNGEGIGYPAQSALISMASADTTAPNINWTFIGDSSYVKITDIASGLAHVTIDTANNFSVVRDSGFVEGDSIESAFINPRLSDGTKDALLSFTAYDMAGNRSVGKLTYNAPQETTLKPGFTFASAGFDTVRVGTSKTVGIATLTDTSSVWPITFDSIWTDNPVFLDSALADKTLLRLAPGESHSLLVTFSPVKPFIYNTFLHARSMSAGTQQVALIGSGYTTSGVTAGTAGSLNDWLTNGSGTMSMLPPSPNPAKSSLTINYALREGCNTEFEIFSESGVKVYNWKGANESSGIHSQTLDISKIEAGSYIYRFSANGEIKTGKILIGM